MGNTGERRPPVGTYAVRRYESDDRDGVLALDRAVWDRTRTTEWFAWKYEENPYLDEPPVFVAERNGEIVGARPLLAFRMRAGDETAIALQPADTMVHPDHRRQGIFTEMNRRAIAHYADREPRFFFNFPNQRSRPGYRKLGWRTVRPMITYYRIQNPEPFVRDRLGAPAGRLLGSLAAPLARGYHAIQQPSSDRGNINVERFDGLPIDRLTELYERRVPTQLHALRDGTFYRWRFASPVWNRTTYIATIDGAAGAAVVVRTRVTGDGVTVTQLAEVVPLTGGATWSAALSVLLGEIVDDHAHADVLSIPESGVPHDLLASYGFRRDDRPPLANVTRSDSMLVARPIGDAGWRLDGCTLSERDDWLLSFGERDTS